MANFLVKVPLFHSLSERQRDQLENRFVTRQYESGENIVVQGKGGAGLFVVISGRAEAVVESMDGAKTVVNAFEAADFFGEIALLDDGPRTASVIAREDTECKVLSHADFMAIMKDDADMGVAISAELAKRLRRTVSVMG